MSGERTNRKPSQVTVFSQPAGMPTALVDMLVAMPVPVAEEQPQELPDPPQEPPDAPQEPPHAPAQDADERSVATGRAGRSS